MMKVMYKSAYYSNNEYRQIWRDCDYIHLDSCNFKSRVYNIDGVTYTEDSKQFREAFEQELILRALSE